VKVFVRLGGLLVVIGAVAAGTAASLVRIEVGQSAIVLRLGRYVRTLGPGLGFRVPGLETLEREQVTDRRIDFGGVPALGAEAESELGEPRMLTGDQNLVDLQFFTEYRVADVRDYRLRVLDPELVIREVVRSTMREVVGRSQVDDVIGAGRGAIPDEVRRLATERLERYQLGVDLTQVGLQSVEPPDDVKPAFDDVTSSIQDRDRLIQDAERFRAERVQRASGEAAEILAQARAARDSAIVTAEGESARFVALLAKYRQAPQITRSRLYLETLEKILPRMEKVILEQGSGERILPYLPIGRPLPAGRPLPTGTLEESRSPDARAPEARPAEKP
jgi:membrane protease subunit HflK